MASTECLLYYGREWTITDPPYIRTVVPWILLSIFALLLLTYIPAISLFLPDLLYR